MAICAGVVSYHCYDLLVLENANCSVGCKVDCLGLSDRQFGHFEGVVEAACDLVGSVFGLLLLFKLVVWELMTFVNADALLVGFVFFCHLSGFVLCSGDASF